MERWYADLREGCLCQHQFQPPPHAPEQPPEPASLSVAHHLLLAGLKMTPPSGCCAEIPTTLPLPVVAKSGVQEGQTIAADSKGRS